MRLLFLSSDFAPSIGGVQTYAAELSRRLSERCDRLVVLAPGGVESNAFDARFPAEVIRIGTSPNQFPLMAPPGIARLSRRIRFDAAFATSWQAALAAALAAPFGGPSRIVCAAHGRELLYNPYRGVPGPDFVYSRLRRFMMSRCDRFLPVSGYTAELLARSGVDAERIRILHNGVDTRCFHPDDGDRARKLLGFEDRTILLSVGRLVRRKGFDRVIGFLPRLLERHPDILYVVAGDGPERARLEQAIARSSLQEHVRLIGDVRPDELRAYYAASHVVVLPVRDLPDDVEGCGLVLLEAAACARPVVASRCGGVEETVRHGQTGLLVEAASDGRLLGAIDHLLSLPDRGLEMGRIGRRTVADSADWNVVADRLFESISELLGRSITNSAETTRETDVSYSFRF